MPGRRSICFIALALSVTALLVTSLGTRASVAPVSREALAARFDSDMRHVVDEWDPNDPRPRGRAPEGVVRFHVRDLRSVSVDPAVPLRRQSGDPGRRGRRRHDRRREGRTRAVARQRAGSGIRDGAERGRATPARRALRSAGPSIASSATRRKSTASRTSARAPKLFDEVWLGEALKRLTADQWLARLPRNPRRLRAGRGSEPDSQQSSSRQDRFAHPRQVDGIRRVARGAVHEAAQRCDAGVDEVGRGDVKTPPLWHTAAKMPVGRWYTDGSFHGPFPLMASSMELEKDRPFDALVEVVVPEDQGGVRFGHPAPPAAALSVCDRSGAGGARTGAVLLARGWMLPVPRGRTTAGATCEWPGVHADVGTDRSRIDVVSDGFIDAFNSSPLAATAR